MNIEEKIKDYFTTKELVEQPWFPIKSSITIKKLVETGALEGINVSTNPKFKRYRIPKESIINFLVSRNQKLGKKRSKKRTKK